MKEERARTKYLANKRAADEKEASKQSEEHKSFTKLPGASCIPLDTYMKWHLEYKESGNPESEEKWMLRKVWEEAHSPKGSERDFYGSALDFAREEDFTTYFQKICCCREMAEKAGETVEKWTADHFSEFKDIFVRWKTDKENNIRERFSRTHLPKESFAEWRQQQDDSEWMPPRPFVALNEKQRKRYCTKVESGRLVRNGFPYDSSGDHSIFHKGAGVGIFVVGHDGNLYCGGHVKDVFHHSSFFGSEAIMCGGEIGTDKDGKITLLSNKSGHYTPTEEQNIQMLEWFAHQGVNLDEVTFAYTKAGVKTPIEMNAGEYLKEAKDRAEALKNQWLEFKKLPGTAEVSFGQYKAWLNEPRPELYSKNDEMWVLKKLWEITRSAPDTPYAAVLVPKEEDDFTSYSQKIWFCRKRASEADLSVGEWLNENLATFREEFEAWSSEEKDRFQKSHLALPYNTWINQQDDSVWIPPRSHVFLNEEQKLPYTTTVESGRLLRNGHPYDSSPDCGLVQKDRGIGIFVLDNEDKLYCGGYVKDVFDHSSFNITRGWAKFEGEIGTDADGRISFLSNKSKRIQEDTENIKLLQYFADHGVDLHGVRFARYEVGKDEPVIEDAYQYLEEALGREEKLQNEWRSFQQIPGVLNIEFSRYSWMRSQYKRSKFEGSEEKWMLQQAWKANKIDPGQRDLDFETYFQKICFFKEAAQKEGLSIQEWHKQHGNTVEREFREWLRTKPRTP